MTRLEEWISICVDRAALLCAHDEGRDPLVRNGLIIWEGLWIEKSKQAAEGIGLTLVRRCREKQEVGRCLRQSLAQLIASHLFGTSAEAMGLDYEGLLAAFAQQSAIKRLNEVTDVAEVAVLLASDAGAGITGSMISIDGGTAPY